jgi:hypothetical protein
MNLWRVILYTYCEMGCLEENVYNFIFLSGMNASLGEIMLMFEFVQAC